MGRLISVIIPAYNEEDSLGELVKRLKKIMLQVSDYAFEVIVVENGSGDSTFEKLTAVNKEDRRFKILQFSRNFGCDAALMAGLSYAKGDAAVLMNADLQDPPEMIPQFIKKWEEGYEIVYGVINKRVGVKLSRKIFSSLFYEIINRLTKGLFPKNVSDFRLIDKKVYQAINSMKERNCFLRGMVIWTGFKQTGIPFDRPPRFAGEPKADIFELVKVALNGIFSFSYLPLRLITLLGIVLSVLSFSAGVLYIMLFFIYGREVAGFTTLITSILFLFGVLFFILGIIGEYLARIYDEVKQRPNFVVKNSVGF